MAEDSRTLFFIIRYEGVRGTRGKIQTVPYASNYFSYIAYKHNVTNANKREVVSKRLLIHLLITTPAFRPSFYPHACADSITSSYGGTSRQHDTTTC